MADKTDSQRVMPKHKEDHYNQITEANATNSLLLRLPAELRTMIYQYAQNDITIDVRYTHDTPLILTCRQIKNEAPQLDFSRVLFYYSDINCLLNPRVAPGQNTRSLITTISVNYNIAYYMILGPHNHNSDRRIHFPNLKKMIVRRSILGVFGFNAVEKLNRNCGCEGAVILFDL